MPAVISRDRLLHWAIVYGTAPLPRPARIALRYQLMAHQRQAMLRRANVVMIRHPKTGSTWLRTLLTQLYALRDGISPRRVFTSDELDLQKPGLPRYLISNGYYSLEKILADAYRDKSPILNGKKTVLLARNPGDVVVSWHRQYQNRTKAFKRELIEADVGGNIDWQSLDRWSFIQRPELGLMAIIRYYNFWAEALCHRDDALILRYEDLRADTPGTLARLVEFLGESFTSDQLDQAVAFASVDNMRVLEREGYFQNASLRLRKGGATDALKVRRAKVGGYRDDLTPEQAAWVEQQVLSHSHPALGYGGAGATPID